MSANGMKCDDALTIGIEAVLLTWWYSRRSIGSKGSDISACTVLKMSKMYVTHKFIHAYIMIIINHM